MTDHTDLVKRLRADPWNEWMEESADVIEAQAARIAELEAALRPFAKLNDCVTGDKWRDYETQWINLVYDSDFAPTIAQLRAARAALGEKE